MIGTLFLFLLLALYLAYLKFAKKEGARGDTQAAYEWEERSAMPRVIADGRLLLSEEYFRTEVPRRLGARFDQVFLGADGLIYSVDTKRRKKRQIHRYDQVELSVQGAVLRHGRIAVANGHAVAPFGFIRLVVDGSLEYRRVPLLGDDELAHLHDRYYDLHAGNIAANGPDRTGACVKCAYLQSCPTGRERLGM